MVLEFYESFLLFGIVLLYALVQHHTLREILLVVLTKRSQLYIFSKWYKQFCKTYQYSKVDGTKYATKFLL